MEGQRMKRKGEERRKKEKERKEVNGEGTDERTMKEVEGKGRAMKGEGLRIR